MPRLVRKLLLIALGAMVLAIASLVLLVVLNWNEKVVSVDVENLSNETLTEVTVVAADHVRAIGTLGPGEGKEMAMKPTREGTLLVRYRVQGQPREEQAGEVAAGSAFKVAVEVRGAGEDDVHTDYSEW